MGNLTRDPELSYTPSNTAVCKFGLATNHKWKDKSGEMREQVCFVDCTLFGRGGETFNQYMKKGRSVLVEGRLDFQQWTAQDGGKRSKHGIVVDTFQFVGGRGDDSQGGGYREQRQPAPAQAGGGGGGGGPSGNDVPPGGFDDVPF